MVSKAIHATYDGQSFHVTDPIDIAPNTECIIYVEEVQDKKPVDAIDYLFSIKETSDGGYIVTGFSYSNDGDVSGNHGDADYWIVKLNPAGAISWQKSFGGKATDEANSIRQTRDGGYIIAGASASNDGDVTGNHGDTDYWIVKLATDGNLKWEKSLGGSKYDAGQSVLQTNDGGYIIAGVTHSEDGDITGNRDQLFT